MGWENYHLYDFEVGGERYTDPRGMADLDMGDASRVKLSRVAPEGEGEVPLHLRLRRQLAARGAGREGLPPEEGQTYPVCIAGKRACPPEDVGGPWGYMEFAEAIRDPEHEQHEEFLEWRGEFDPEAFDPDAVNERIRAAAVANDPTRRGHHDREPIPLDRGRGRAGPLPDRGP